MSIIWIITIALAVLFVVLFLVGVLKKKRLLSDVTDEAQRQALKFSEFLKMAYPAALIYAVLYAVFVVLCTCEVFGGVKEDMNAATWIPSLLLVYLVIWLLLHIINMDCQSQNKPFADVLKTINTNTGVSEWNFILLVISAGVLIASIIMLVKDQSYYICSPLFFAVMVSVLINLFVGSNDDWPVKAPSASRWRPASASSPDKVKIKAASQDGGDEEKSQPANPNGKTPVERRFRWDLKDKWGIDTDPGDEVKITLFKEDWEDPEQDMRKKNPFYGKDADGNMNWKAAQADLQNAAVVVVQGPDGNGEESEKKALETIVDSAIDVADKYNMAEYEVPELLLTLCQNDIPYKEDQVSKPINQFNVNDEQEKPHLEYFRFAAETLYDVEGDCDCKSILACRLMKALGMDAKLVTVCDKGQTLPNHAAIIFRDDYNRYKRLNNARYSQYTYCEATSEGWKIGDVPEEVDENSIAVLA